MIQPAHTPVRTPACTAGRLLCALIAGVMLAVAGTARAEEAAAFSAKIDGDFLQRVWETADGLMPTYVPAVAQTTDGYVWLAVFDNVVRFDGVRAMPFSGKTTPGVLPSPVRGDFAHGDRAGGLWMGTSDGRLFTMSKSVWREMLGADGWSPMRIISASEAPDGRIVFCGKERIVVLTDGKLAEVKPPPQRADVKNPALRALFDTTGRLHAATTAGLWRRDDGKWIALFQNETPKWAPQGTVRASGGGVWVGVEDGGLVRLCDGVQPLVLSREQGLPIASITAMLEDSGMLWLAGEKGLVRLDLSSVEDFASAKHGRLKLQLFDRGDGLSSDIFRRSYQPVATRATDGRLWFATHKGVASLDPHHFTTPEREVPALIEEIHAERELIIITPQNRGNIVIPARTKHMTVRCSMPTLSKPDFTEIEYRLDGLDDRWYSTGTERVIRLYDLAPGTYRFLVRGIGTDGRPVEPADSVGMTILPAYWQTQWFRVLAIAAGVIFVAAIARLGVRRRLAQRELQLAQQEERARLENELQQMKRAEVIGRLAGGIAHDFNNILAAILGNAELARLEYGQNKDLADMLDSILSAGERARELIVQILSYSRQRRTEPVPLDIAPALHESLKLLRSGTPATVEIVTEIPESLPLVLADATEVHRILMNLGTNAVQAMGPGGGRVTITATETFGGEDAHPEIPRGRRVCLRVADNGAGVDDETLQRIFDPFFTTKELGKGSGLGLSVVKGIIESLNGVIVVESTPAAGTTFRVFFPIVNGSSVHRIAAPAGQPVMSERAERIFLVDDEPQVLSVGRRTLEGLGYEVTAHGSATAALTAFLADAPRWDLVITDFAMPGMNGVEFARQIRTRRSDIPIILCTGFGGAVDAAAAKSIGIVQVINKPFGRQALSEAVAKALGKGTPAQGQA